MNNCKIERRKVVTHYTWNMASGKKTVRATTVEIGPCGIPLFSDAQHKSGICSSCSEGWSTKDNQITPHGYKQLKESS
jgi:hypothetical protein